MHKLSVSSSTLQIEDIKVNSKRKRVTFLMDYISPHATVGNDVCRKIVNTVSAPAAIGPYNQVNFKKR